MLNFGTNSIIVISFSLLCANCASSESYDEFTFHDHSDEHELSKREIKLSQTTVSCQVPITSTGRLDKIYDWDRNLITDRKSGSLVPKFTQIECECVEGYILPDGNNMSSSYCDHKSSWDPLLKPCHRTCPSLQTSNVVLTCKDKRGGIIDCNGPLTSGTQVTAHCMALHQVDPLSRTDSDFIRCRDDGRWDRELIKCIPDCGIPLHQPLIANGSVAQFGEFPWHVAIYKVPIGNKYICGGTLITSNMILSAAHCFYDDAKGEPRKDPDDYVIIVGKMTSAYDRVDNYETQKFQVSKILFAPKEYKPAISYASDIAIIILKKNITISQYVLPACFIRPERFGFNPGKGTIGALPGWGLDESDKVSDTLKMARLPFMDYNECSEKLAHVTIDKFCAGAETGPKPLQGDSGGGLVFKEGLFYYVRGIVSTRGKWSSTSLTTFTDISYYLNWIETVIQQSASGNVNDDQKDTSTERVANLSAVAATSTTKYGATSQNPIGSPVPIISASGPTTRDACQARNSAKLKWSCKAVAHCIWSSRLLSTSQNYRCDKSKATICCPEKVGLPSTPHRPFTSNKPMSTTTKRPVEQPSTSAPVPSENEDGPGSFAFAPSEPPEVPSASVQPEQKPFDVLVNEIFGTEPPSPAEPKYIQIVRQKCDEYAEARFQNACVGCKKVMDCDRVETLIVGGTGAKPKEFPHMALIGHGKDINNIKWDGGGGTLISERFILTCARCVSKDAESENERPTWIGLGFLNRSELTPAERNGKLFAVDGNFRHPKFNSSFVYHDIGLIRLKDPVKFTPYIRPLCLHTEYNIPRESLKDTTVLGWGVNKDWLIKETLQKVKIRVLPHQLCSSLYSKQSKVLPEGYDDGTMICAGFPEQGRDTCTGDGGGPIQIKHASECMYTQLGIISFGISRCGNGDPAVYTRISSYLEWIQGIVWPERGPPNS